MLGCWAETGSLAAGSGDLDSQLLFEIAVNANSVSFSIWAVRRRRGELCHGELLRLQVCMYWWLTLLELLYGSCGVFGVATFVGSEQNIDSI